MYNNSVLYFNFADDDDDEGNNEDSTLNRPARYIVREAFYSSNTQPSRNLVKSFELAEKNDVGRDNSQGEKLCQIHDHFYCHLFMLV